MNPRRTNGCLRPPSSSIDVPVLVGGWSYKLSRPAESVPDSVLDNDVSRNSQAVVKVDTVLESEDYSEDESDGAENAGGSFGLDSGLGCLGR